MNAGNELVEGVLHGLSLCSGIGGLELGLRLALGSSYRTVCYVESEIYCVEVLVRRMQEGWLDECPVWDNIDTFPCDDWRGKVDIITAGFPCQPVSCAGQRKAQDDERWLWPFIEKIVGDVRPEWCFFENVRGLLSANSGRAFGEVLGGLARLGYDVEWDCFRASDVGAPHRRERVFILAHRQLADTECVRQHGKGEPEKGATGRVEARSIATPHSKEMADTSCECEPRAFKGRGIGGQSKGEIGDRGRALEGRVAHAKDEGLERGESAGSERSERCPAQSCQLPVWPPNPTERDRWLEVIRQWPELAPALADTSRQFASRGQAREVETDQARSQDVSGHGREPDTRRGASSSDNDEAVSRPESSMDDTKCEPMRVDGKDDGETAGKVDPTEVAGTDDNEATVSDTEGSGQLRTAEPKDEGTDKAAGRGPNASDLGGGCTEIAPKPAVRGMAHGTSSRMDRLRACGNAVVPPVVALAFWTLYNRMKGN